MRLRTKPNRHAAISMLVVGVYLQFVEWIDMFPWNDIRSGNGQETLDLILAGVTFLFVISLWFGGKWAAALSSIGMLVWIYLQISTWWIPYFFGASEGWKRVYANWFSETVHILPSTADNLPPDANHLLLHILILVALVVSMRALLLEYNS